MKSMFLPRKDNMNDLLLSGYLDFGRQGTDLLDGLNQVLVQDELYSLYKAREMNDMKQKPGQKK